MGSVLDGFYSLEVQETLDLVFQVFLDVFIVCVLF